MTSRKVGSDIDDFMEALTIFKKYVDSGHGLFHCEHDILYVCGGIEPENVSEEDIATLEVLGFDVGGDLDGFYSFRFGSS